MSLTEGVDNGIPPGEAVFRIIGAKAQLERDLLPEQASGGPGTKVGH